LIIGINNMKKNIFSNIFGFTLIEIIIYISIFSMIVFSISYFMNMLNNSRVHNQNILEVEDQGESIIRNITYKIRNAKSINNPTAGNSESSLNLEMADSSINPTIYSITNGVIYIKEGTGTNIALSNNKVNISGLTFTNEGAMDKPGSIKIRFNLNTIMTKNSYESSFYGSSSIR